MAKPLMLLTSPTPPAAYPSISSWIDRTLTRFAPTLLSAATSNISRGGPDRPPHRAARSSEPAP
jgi:hypothetical protein